MKRIFCFLLVICLIFTAFTASVTATSHLSGAGLDFEFYTHKKGTNTNYYSADYYQSVKKLAEVPHTFESWIYASQWVWDRGVILGNDSARSGGRFSYAINDDFFPELTFKDKNGAVHSAVFNQVRLPSSTWIHLVITYDEAAEEFRCYLDGDLKQTIAFSTLCATTSTKCGNGCAGIFSTESAAQYSFLLGGDLNYLNPNYFGGYIQDVALYGSVLSDAQIQENYLNGVDADNENLILYYDIDFFDKREDIEDLSGNGYHLSYSKAWLSEDEMEAEREKKGFSGEYDYAIAVIGDPQYATKSNPEAVRAAYTWLAENKNSKNIQYVVGVGDITDQCQEREWLEAADALKILENAGLYYSLVRGNHDVATVSGIDDSSKATAKPELFDQLFAAEGSFYLSQFTENGGVYEQGSVKNTYRTLDCYGNKWLVLNLDYRVDDAVLAWARGVLESHPEHRVIIATHDYLGASNVRTSNGNKIWNGLASLYENVVLVLGGHVSWDNIEVSQVEGVNGNTVTQMLINPQRTDLLLSGVGLVTMFYFSENGQIVDVEYYSPEWDKYFKNCNQMQLDLKSERFKDTVVKPSDTTVQPDAAPTVEADKNPRVAIIIASCSVAIAVLSAACTVFVLKRRKNKKDITK